MTVCSVNLIANGLISCVSDFCIGVSNCSRSWHWRQLCFQKGLERWAKSFREPVPLVRFIYALSQEVHDCHAPKSLQEPVTGAHVMKPFLQTPFEGSGGFRKHTYDPYKPVSHTVIPFIPIPNLLAISPFSLIIPHNPYIPPCTFTGVVFSLPSLTPQAGASLEAI